MTVMGRPRIPNFEASEFERLIAALDVHGGLLRQELIQLRYSEETIDSGKLPILAIETIIGKLYVSKVKRHFVASEEIISTPGRTVNAAIDGAYMRLFIKRTPGMWNIGNAKILGQMWELPLMPTVIIDGKKFYVVGKPFGSGISRRSLQRYVNQNSAKVFKEKSGIIVVSPDVEKYKQIGASYPGMMKFCQYTLEEVKRENS